MFADMRVVEKKAIRLCNDLNEGFEVLKKRLEKKTDLKLFGEFCDKLQKFVVFEDLQELYQKCIPPLESFTITIEEVRIEQEQIK
jgi:hypothetical protein